MLEVLAVDEHGKELKKRMTINSLISIDRHGNRKELLPKGMILLAEYTGKVLTVKKGESIPVPNHPADRGESENRYKVIL